MEGEGGRLCPYPNQALSKSLRTFPSDTLLATLLSCCGKHTHFLPNIPFLPSWGEDPEKANTASDQNPCVYIWVPSKQ